MLLQQVKHLLVTHLDSNIARIPTHDVFKTQFQGCRLP